MNEYIILASATLFFSLQFLFTKVYQLKCGSGMRSTAFFCCISAAIIAVLSFAIGGFSFKITWFSFLIAFCQSAIFIAFNIVGIKSMCKANFSVFSVFTMLGGMFVPFVFGLLFLSEKISIVNGIGVALIIFALCLTIEKSDKKEKAYLLYIAVFLLNGLSGTIMKIHQINVSYNVSTVNYMTIYYIISFFVCLIYLLLTEKKNNSEEFKIKPKNIWLAAIFAIMSGLGAFCNMTAAIKLPATVQFPVVTGGVVILGALYGLLLKEKINVKKLIAIILTVISTILFVL